MLSATMLAEYGRLRAKRYPANVALRVVRHNEKTKGIEWEFDRSFTVDGFDVTVTIQPEEDPDISHRGEFSDDPTGHSEGYALRNYQAGRGDYKWFRLTNPVPDVAKALIQHHRYGRREAYDEAWRQAKEDLRAVLDYEQVYVVVTASRNGVTLGRESLGGIETDGDYDEVKAIVVGDGMIENAVDDARETLRKLCATTC